MKFMIVFFTLYISTLFSVSSAYRILAVFPFNAKSHNIVFEALVKGLIKRGHHVDHVTHFPIDTALKNYKTIINLDGSMEKLMNNYTMEFVSQINDDVVNVIALLYGNRICEFLGFDQFQELIKNPPKDPPYELVITEAFSAHCYMGLGYVFNVPVVAVSSAIEYPWVSHFTGNNDNLAIVPNAYLIRAGEMNFWERAKNVYTNFMGLYKFHTITERNQTEIMRKYLRPDIPSIREVEKNVALILVNNHPILFGVKPMTPTLVQIAGLHIEENEEIVPVELKKWMDESVNGIVYFTFGSMVLIETLPKTQLDAIYASFKKISPIRVLMKIANETQLPPGLPKNVKTSPWTPQQSVLAHPNTKIFITHGGLGGLQEALYYGVPMIGVPLFSDQFRNVEAFVAKKMMIRINLDEFSERTLYSALTELIQNPIFKEQAIHYSKLFRDQPLSPMSNAIFWIEYIIRNGPNVLKSPALEFTWWQLALLDVYGSMLLIIVLACITLLYGVKLTLKKLSNYAIDQQINKKIN